MVKKLRIAMVIPYANTSSGGVSYYVEAIATILTKRGHTVHVYGCKNKRYAFPHFTEISEIFSIPMPNGFSWSYVRALPGIHPLELLQTGKYDLFHFQDSYVPFLSYQIIPQLDAPVIVTLHNSWQQSFIVEQMTKRMSVFRNFFAQNIEGVIYVSKGTKKFWQYLVKSSIPQKIIYNGVSNDYKPKERKPNKEITLLYIGRLVKRKGILYLVAAMKQLVQKYPYIRLIVIGTGPEKEKAEKYVHKHNLQAYVSFKGEVIGDKKIEYMQHADIFCATYKHEAFALTILEAMACGLPIAGFWDEGMAHALTDYPGKHNVFTDDYTPEALSHVLGKLIEDESLRKKLRDWNIRQSKHFSWERVTDETEDFYYQVLNGKN